MHHHLFVFSMPSLCKKEMIPCVVLVSGQSHFTDEKTEAGQACKSITEVRFQVFLYYQPADRHLDQNTGPALETSAILPSPTPPHKGVFLGSFSGYDSRAIMETN